MSVQPPDSRRRLRTRAAVIASAVFAPSPHISVSAWADQHRVLTTEMGAVEPGVWRTRRIPYLREVMDTLGDPAGPRRVVFMKSSQTGGSEVGHNWLLYTMHQEPQPFLFLLPTEGLLKDWSTTKLDPMLASTECLAGRIADSGGRRDSGDTMTRKKFPGGYFLGLSGRSTSRLRLSVAARAMADEIDELEVDIRGQGDPLALLERAMRTFLDAGARLYLVSTPTLKGFSRIEREYEESDQRRYYVPCPHCGHRQTLRFRGFDRDGEWSDTATGALRLICDRGADGELIPSTVRYLCEECGVLIDERHREQMLATGEWRAQYPGRTIAGFHINTLYSPLVSWAAVVTEFLKSKASGQALKTFVNLWLGLPFEERGSKIEPHVLALRAESYPAQVPSGAGVLTGFVDVQGDRLESLTVGWGAREEAWTIAWEQWPGDPGQRTVWDQLEAEWLNRVWKHAGGAGLRMAAVGVDANYQTDAVHDFCDRFDRARVIPTIGRSGRGGPLLTSPAQLKYKRSRQRTRPNWVINADAGKDRLASRLALIPGPDPTPEAVHFPDSLDAVFYEQLTSEVLRPVYVHGRPTRQWTLLPNRRNEALDLWVGNMAALAHLGPRVTNHLAALVDQVNAAGGSRNPEMTREGGTVLNTPRGRRTRSSGMS